MPTVPHIQLPQGPLAALCGRFGVRRLALFGSVLRDDFRPDSDVDFLVEFEETARTGFRVVELESAISQLIGRRADVRTSAELSRYFRDEVEQGAFIAFQA